MLLFLTLPCDGDRLDKGLLDFGIMVGPRGLKKYDCVKLPGVDIMGGMPGRRLLAEKDAIHP